MRTITTILLMFAFLGLFAATPDEQFKEASNAYAGKDFAKASQLYQSLADSGYESANLFYNLGCSYYKLNQTADAILYLEKAKKIEPGNDDIDFNLRLANLRVADKIETLPELSLVKKTKELLAAHSSRAWGYVAIFFLWLALVFLTVFLFVKQGVAKRITFFVGAVSFVLSITTFGFAWGQASREQSSRYAIVYATNTYIKSAPDKASLDLFILREGVKVELLENSGDWEKIKVPDAKGDKVGWIPKEMVREI